MLLFKEKKNQILPPSISFYVRNRTVTSLISSFYFLCCWKSSNKDGNLDLPIDYAPASHHVCCKNNIYTLNHKMSSMPQSKSSPNGQKSLTRTKTRMKAALVLLISLHCVFCRHYWVRIYYFHFFLRTLVLFEGPIEFFHDKLI